MSKILIDELRNIVRKLDATGDDGFEGLLAVVLTDVTKTTFSLAKSGSQRGKDGQSTFDLGTINFEGKRYDGAVPKNEVLSKIAEIAADDKGHVDLWILGSTGTIRTQDVESITALGERLAISTLILDWSAAGLPGLGTLLAMAPDQTATFIADNTTVPQPEILKALNAVREHEQFDDRARELATAIEQPSIGPAYALKRNIEYLGAAFGSRAEARAVFGQALAPGDSSVLGVLDRSALRISLAELTFGKPNGKTVAVLGSDGNGKSWLFGQCWLKQSIKPLTIVFIPDDIKDQFTLRDVEPLLVAALIGQTGDTDTEISRARWHKHITRWRKLKPPESPRLVVFFDGLNQRESIGWTTVINTFAKVVAELGGKVVFSCRTPFYRTSIKPRLLELVDTVDVPEWSDPELEMLLTECGTSMAKLQQPVVDFLRNPRILAVAVELFEQGRIKEFRDLSISRLLFEHIRVGASPATELLSVAEFVRGVRNHADEIIERLKKPDILDLHVFTRKVGPATESSTLQDQLAIISAGRFFAEVSGDATLYSLKEEGLPFALGLSLLSIAQLAERNHLNIRDELSKILDPISALDNTAEVLISALIAAVLGDDTLPGVITALATSYLALQNLDETRYQEFRTLIGNAPAAFLDALEDATIAEAVTSNLSWLTSAFLDSRDEPEIWAAMTLAAQRWLSMYSFAPERGVYVHHLEDSEKKLEAINKQKLVIEAKITARSNAEKALFDNMVREERGDYTKLNRIAFEFLAGRSLRAFGEAFRNWCVAVSFNGGISDGRKDFYHLVQFNRIDWQETRAFLLTAAEILRLSDTSNSGRWALVYILQVTADPADAKEAVSIVEDLTKDREQRSGWRLIEDWCETDPCDPSSQRPDNIAETATAYEELDVTKLVTSRGQSRDDFFFKHALAGLVRFEPEAALKAMRRFADNVVTRATAEFRGAAVLLGYHTAALDCTVVAAFVDKASAIADEKLAGADDKHKELFLASQNSLTIALPHMTGDEQLTALMQYSKIDNILLDNCELMQSAGPRKYEAALEKAHADGDTINQFRLMAFAKYTDTNITDRAKMIIGKLTASSTELVRLCAFGAVWRLKDPDLLRLVVASGWNANLLDSTKSRFEIWYGSQILVLAASKALISVPACIDRIELDTYLDFARTLGSEAVSVVTVRIDTALKKAAGYDVKVALPDIQQRMGTGDHPDLYNVEDWSNRKENLRDSLERLAETGAEFHERQERNREAVDNFEQELTSAGARIIIGAVTPELIAMIFAHAPAKVHQWHRKFLVINKKSLRAVHNIALAVAQTIAAEDQAGAVELFERLATSDPFVRLTVGNADISFDAITIWAAGDGDELRKLRFRRLDSARNDAEITREVLAAINAGKTKQLQEYVLDRHGRPEPAYIARAIMIAGLCVEASWALEIIDSHKDDCGFLSTAYDAAKYAMERHQWAKHWAHMMRNAKTAPDLWRYSILLATIVDGRFHQEEVKNGPIPELIERFGTTLNAPIQSRVKKWQGKREKVLFGGRVPNDIFLV